MQGGTGRSGVHALASSRDDLRELKNGMASRVAMGSAKFVSIVASHV